MDMQLVVRTMVWSNNFLLLRGYPECAACWVVLDALCHEGCEGYGSGYGSANGLSQPRMELAERLVL